MFGIDDLFDLDGNGKLNGVEMAFAYSVIFEDDNDRQAGIDTDLEPTEGDSDSGSDKWDW